MNRDNIIRIITIDHHPLAHLGIEVMLRNAPDIWVAGQAHNAAEAIRLCQEICPDVVLLGLNMPETDGVALTHDLLRVHPGTSILALTCADRANSIVNVLQAGAISYLFKNVSADTLIKAIRTTHQRQPVLTPEAMQALVRASRHPRLPGEDLTEREREILALMVKGLNNTKIAERLGVSPFTVKNHVSRILDKMAVASRSEAVALAVQHQVVRVD
ncbi:MAG: response regulator transcription factor [bacterium]|nr:response regulator transcription factor [bacterium]